MFRVVTYVSLPALVVACALMAATGVLLGVAIPGGFIVAALAGVWLVYLGERLVDAPEDAFNHPERTRWIAAHRRGLVGLCGGCVVVGGAAALTLRPQTLAGAALLGLAGAAYALPLFGRRLKTFFLAKPLLVGATWASATVLLPLVEARHPVGAAALLLLAARALAVTVNVLLHDWAERAGDREARASVLPQAWRWRHVQAAAGLLLVMALLCEALLVRTAGPLALVDAAGVPLLALAAVREPSGNWYESLLLDLIVAWPLVTAVAAG